MKYFNYRDEIMNHFNSLEEGKLAFCFGWSNSRNLYSNLCYYRIVKKIDDGCMGVSVEVRTEDCNELDDDRIFSFHPMQVYQIEEGEQECLTKHYQNLKKSL